MLAKPTGQKVLRSGQGPGAAQFTKLLAAGESANAGNASYAGDGDVV